METQFRLTTGADIDVLLGFMRQFYAIDNYPFEEHAARSALERLVGDASLGRVWLIDKAGEAIGYIVLVFGYSLEYRGRDAFVDELFLVENQRNQGLGSQAMQFILEACRDLDVQALHLEVERTNIAGQKLYRKFGFEDHDRYLLTRRITH
jgi:GNAT superfamily N-acetyltransferase